MVLAVSERTSQKTVPRIEDRGGSECCDDFCKVVKVFIDAIRMIDVELKHIQKFELPA